jgi:hypothetical protein
MWVVLRYEKKKLQILIQELKRKFNTNLTIYNPKFKIKLKKKNKYIINKPSLLGDYLFCYNNNFCNSEPIEALKFTKGVKNLINGYISSQNEIKEFISKCRKSENKDGYLTNKIFNLYKNSKFKFSSGSFTNFMFKIVNLQKNKMNILIGNLNVTTKKDKFIFEKI